MDEPLFRDRFASVYAMKALGQSFQSPSAHAISTVRGNYPVLVGIGLPNIGPFELLKSEAHLVLRGLIGQMGRKLDKTFLPLPLQNTIGVMDEQLRYYQKHGTVLHKMFEQHIGVPQDDHSPILFDTVDDLKKHISEKKPELLKEKTFAVNLNDMMMIASDMISTVQRTEDLFSGVDTIRLKGCDTEFDNHGATKSMPNIGKWMYYAELGAKVFADTVKIPDTLSIEFTNVLLATDKIVPRACDGVLYNDALQEPMIVALFDQAVHKAQQRFVLCGNYNEIAAYEPAAKIIQSVGITSRETFDAIKGTAGPVMPSAKHPPQRHGTGKCPFGHGPQ